ncbi:MAG: acyl-CoA dehydrogenase family protein [Syntrophaceae bacterium]
MVSLSPAMDYFPYPKEWETEESHSMAQTVARWANQELITKRLEFREVYAHQMKALDILSRELGLDEMVWSVESGGSGLLAPTVATTLVRGYEEMGRADPGIAYVSAMKMALACFLTEGIIGPHVTEEIKRAVFSAFYAGDMKLVSIILPGLGDAGQAARAMISGKEAQATAERRGDTWVVRARQARPMNSGFDAHMYAVIAAAQNEIVLVLVPADAQGVKKASAPLKTTGLLASRNCSVDFDTVEVPLQYGIPINLATYKRFITWIDLLCGAVAVGSAMDAYVILKNWADNRVIKGGMPFRDNPMCAAVLANLAMSIMNSRLLVHSLARAMAQPEVFGIRNVEDCFVLAQSASLKAIAECWHGMDRGMELMASAGYSKEWNLEKHWRDIKTMQAYLGGGIPAQMDIARAFFGSGGNA